MARKAIITGITGQDGSYLAELLLEQGYQVHGIIRRASSYNFQRIQHLLDKIKLHPADLLDQRSLIKVIKEVRPHEIYNFASQSFVYESWNQPIFTAEVTALGVTRILEAVLEVDPEIKFLQASSSEMYGNPTTSLQNEETPFRPCNPYAIAKLYAHWMTITYRQAYKMFACCSIAFNHESPRRGEEFVTRKITKAVARIKAGKQNELVLGNLDAKRDWGFAGDYVRAMWMMLQQETPDDYVIATGQTHTVREFVQKAFSYAGLDYTKYVKTDPKFQRPVDVSTLCGDATKIKTKLGWKPEVNFDRLVKMMVEHDLKLEGVL